MCVVYLMLPRYVVILMCGVGGVVCIIVVFGG